MRHEHRGNWNRYVGSRLPPARRGRHAPTFGRAVPAFGEGRALRDAPVELGRTLAPPPRYRTLLVPVDGEPFGEHALPLALGIARRAGAEVRVAHVHCPLLSPHGTERLGYDSGVDAYLRRRQREYLAGLMRRLAKVTSVPVKPVFLEGREVADALADAAGAGTDLVVMATHGRGPLGRFWSGSVADALLRRLSVPLLFVRGYDAPADLTGDPLPRHILVPLDGSEEAEGILKPALALGALADADHTLLRFLPRGTDHVLGYPGAAARRPLADSRRAEAWDYLRGVADRLGSPALRVHPRLILDERPTARAILDYGRRHDADLIALAAREVGGLARLFRGSLADRVVRGSAAPVLVVRPEVEKAGIAAP